MRNLKQKAALLLLVILLAVTLSGCVVTDGVASLYRTVFGLGSSQLFRIQNEICTRPEAEIFLSSQKSVYEEAYGTTIWKVDVEGSKDFEYYMKDSLLEFLARLKAMQLMADREGVTLTKEEKALCQTAGKEYYSQLGKETAKEMGVSQKLAIRTFQEYHLANKLAEKLVAQENSVVSDSEARIIHIQQIVVQFSDSSQKAAKRQEIQEAYTKALAGSDFESLAKKYSDVGEIELTIGRGELPAEADEAAFALADGTLSPVIETENGFYLIKCQEDYDATATAANKVKIKEQRKLQTFLTAYEAFYESCSAELNEKAWKKLSFGEAPDTEANFYQVYDRYFGEGK